MKKYQCTVCKYEYDPAKGDPTQGIAPCTPFEALPADWERTARGLGADWERGWWRHWE